MTLINKKYSEKISTCIEGNITFALIFMPGETVPRWYSPADPDSVSGSFTVREFGIDHSRQPYTISATPETSPNSPTRNITPAATGTRYDDYISQAESIIATLRRTSGKTVLSRLIAVDSRRPFVEVIDEYFEKFPYTIRFVYNIPQTGLWFGASPELLIDYQSDKGLLETMSLAGTRRAGLSGEWDAKNIAEHRYVTDFITNTLEGLGMNIEITDSTPLQFGSIEHLCDRIRAYGSVNPAEVVDALSPTPALCGTPREDAYRQIVETERHRRHCYGGWIGISDTQRFTAYVNLRSALAAKLPDGTFRYNIYVGGGLTADSDPHTEWLETEAKAAALLSLLTH